MTRQMLVDLNTLSLGIIKIFVEALIKSFTQTFCVNLLCWREGVVQSISKHISSPGLMININYNKPMHILIHLCINKLINIHFG